MTLSRMKMHLMKPLTRTLHFARVRPLPMGEVGLRVRLVPVVTSPRGRGRESGGRPGERVGGGIA
jgi:hypothetical protein